MITKDVKDVREPTEWWSRTSRKMPRISEVRVDNIVRDSAKTSSSHVSWETGTKTTCTHVPAKRPITVSETLYRVEDRSQCWRHCTVSETLRFFAQSGPGTKGQPASRRQSEIAHQQVSDLTQALCPDDTQRCQRHRTPSGSGPVVPVPSLARSCLAVGWRLFVCGGGCRPFCVSVARVAFLGAFPAAFSSFWRFPVSPRLLSGSSFLCRK